MSLSRALGRMVLAFLVGALIAAVAMAVPALAAASSPGFSAAPAGGQPSPPARSSHSPGQTAKLKDRVLAVVDEDPILDSDLMRAVALGGQARRPGETEAAFRRRVLDDLIAERLRFHEIDRYGPVQLPVDLIEKNVQEIRSRFKDDAEFHRKLKELGLDLAALRLLVSRQVEVLTYVDERLGARIFVSLEDITSYYRTTLTPEMQRRHAQVPPLDQVREQIRDVLRKQRLNDELDHWTDDLRRNANITVFLDQPTGPLPPVVKRLDTPVPPSPPAPAAKPAAKRRGVPDFSETDRKSRGR